MKQIPARSQRSKGIKLVLVHGETIVEPVIKGTNKESILSGINILTHPGLITLEDAKLALEKNVYLEITARKGHSLANGHVAKVARLAGAKLVLNTDSHTPENLITKDFAEEVLKLTGSSVKIAYKPLPVDDPKQRQPDITKAKEILGWSPKVDRAEGLRKTYEYFKSLPKEELYKLPKEFTSNK